MTRIGADFTLGHELEPGSPEAFARNYFEARTARLARSSEKPEPSDRQVVIITIITSVILLALVVTFVWATHLGKKPAHPASSGGSHVAKLITPGGAMPYPHALRVP